MCIKMVWRLLFQLIISVEWHEVLDGCLSEDTEHVIEMFGRGWNVRKIRFKKVRR